jgi:glycine cleavage system H protein
LSVSGAKPEEERSDMSYPDDLRYSREHEWVRVDGSRGTIGITSFAADELGDIVFVELPEVGATLKQFDTFGVVESVKAVSDLYAPVSGEVVEVNEALRETPELLNSDPFGEGWIARLELAETGELDGLLDAEAYTAETA